jgi:hypothetical protein
MMIRSFLFDSNRFVSSNAKKRMRKLSVYKVIFEVFFMVLLFDEILAIFFN